MIDENSRNAKPILKWAGGKQQLISQYSPYFPKKIDRYFEPFLGGGAIYFYLWNTKRISNNAYLSDLNEELINVYEVVKNDVENLIISLNEHKNNHNRDYFYMIRNLDRNGQDFSQTERAARTIYLNKTCYNGLFRVNSKGQFNVPLGSYKNPRIVNPDDIRDTSFALQKAFFCVQDFSKVQNLGEKGDFFYFDPPYDPLSKTSNFTNYTADSFQRADQIKLAEVFSDLTKKGCLCMLSNSDTPLIREIYKSHKLISVKAKRAINSNSSRRNEISELLIINY